jgi:hypothetical protein
LDFLSKFSSTCFWSLGPGFLLGVLADNLCCTLLLELLSLWMFPYITFWGCFSHCLKTQIKQ